jgi:hypothetical protein
MSEPTEHWLSLIEGELGQSVPDKALLNHYWDQLMSTVPDEEEE